MTGLELAQRHGATVLISPLLCYDPRTRAVHLPPRVAHGSDAYALACAAHETAHALQPRWWHWLRVIDVAGFPFRNWIEVDAWRRSVRMLHGL